MSNTGLSRRDEAIIAAIMLGFANLIDRLEKVQPAKRARMHAGAQRISNKSLIRTSIRRMAAEGRFSESKRIRDVRKTLPAELKDAYYTDVSDDMLRTARAGVLTRSTNKMERKRRTRGKPLDLGFDAEDDDEGRVSLYKLNPELERIRREILGRPLLQEALNRRVINSPPLLLYVKYYEETYLHLSRLDQSAMRRNVIPYNVEAKVDPHSKAAAEETKIIREMNREDFAKEAEKRAGAAIDRMHKDADLYLFLLRILPQIMEAGFLGLQRLGQASRSQ